MSRVVQDVLLDSGANIRVTETYLVRCHNSEPVVVDLIIQIEEDTVMQKCDRMGYLMMRRKDGSIHKQLFLVNLHAIDSILRPLLCNPVVHPKISYGWKDIGGEQQALQLRHGQQDEAISFNAGCDHSCESCQHTDPR